MLKKRLPWREELAIIDRTMKAISGVTDPEELIEIYFSGVGDLIQVDNYLALSRRGVAAPHYLITRSSRFTEHFNPWTQRDRLPLLSGGILGEIAYAGSPVVIDDLPSRLAADDPAHFYLEGFESLIAMPQYDGGEALNITVLLLTPGEEIDHSMIPMLHWQGGLFGRGTTNLVLRNQLAAALGDLDRELQIVGEIQRSLLPNELPLIEGYSLAAHYETSARAGGDYYDFFPLADGGWGLFIADVSGHGTPAAVVMAITHAIAHSQPGTHSPPGALLAHLNEQFAGAYSREGTFVTAFYAVLDPKTRQFTFARAGHNPPRIVRDGGVYSLEQIGALPLGVVPDQEFEECTIALDSGDLLVLYTDGVTEAMAPGSDDQTFGTSRFDELLVECGGCGAAECVDRIRARLAEFSGGAPPTDDQTLIAMRVI